MINASPDVSSICSDSGWTTILAMVCKKFVVFSGASKDHPVLLLLDGHCSHIKSLKLIDEARANGVIILCFPPTTQL